MSNKILFLLLIAYLFVLSEAIKRKYYKGVTDRGCGLAMGNKCQHKHIFACHQSNCTMNFYRRNATQGEIPWAVLVVDYDVGSTCSGSILNAKWVLTAAHCVKKANPKKVIVFLGTSPQSFNDTFYLVKQIKVHPRFEYYSILGDSYDIALLELKIPIVFGPDVCSVCLPPLMYEHGEKETALFAGYGTYDVRMMLQTGWVSFNGSLIYNNPSDIMQKPFMRVFAWIYRLFSLRYFFGQLQRTGMFICLWRTPPESGFSHVRVILVDHWFSSIGKDGPFRLEFARALIRMYAIRAREECQSKRISNNSIWLCISLEWLSMWSGLRNRSLAERKQRKMNFE